LRPFTRLDAARSQADGSGLGLAIVNRIVQRHGGRLELKDNTPGGLVVVVRFPHAGKSKS
jgi:two-component system osmolarity sensor histidine kinase EnvZ